jgi:hypothetical protein
MKKVLQIALYATVTAMLPFQSCNKLTDVVKVPDVNFTGASTDIVIPPTNDTTDKVTIGQASFSYNLDSMIKAQTNGAVGYSSIKSVKITSITLTLTDPSTANNFANFIYAAAAFNTDANSGGYPAYTIAYIDNNPDSYNPVLLPPIVDATQDVKKYFSSNTTFYYTLAGKLRHPLTATLHCHVDITYDIGF